MLDDNTILVFEYKISIRALRAEFEAACKEAHRESLLTEKNIFDFIKLVRENDPTTLIDEADDPFESSLSGLASWFLTEIYDNGEFGEFCREEVENEARP